MRNWRIRTPLQAELRIVLFPNIQTSNGADTVFRIAGTESSSPGRIMARL